MHLFPLILAALLAGPGALSFENLATSSGVAKGGDPGAVAWFDFDNDGDQDLFVAAIGKNRLFRNDGDGRFTKLKKTGLDSSSAQSFGVAVGDYDNDGFLDLFVANLSGGSALYHNDAGAKFRNTTATAGVKGSSASSYSAAWADFDRDGRLDLYVANGNQNAGTRNFLYHNLGGGRFEDVAGRAGVDGMDSSLGCAWADFDDDGWPDLYVANFGQANRLYRNNGDGTFTDRAAHAGVDDSGRGAGAAWGDYDNDGDLDLYLFNTNLGQGANRLYRNNGDGTFADASAGVRGTGDGEAAVWGDFDNDGWLDLFLVNRSDVSSQRNRLYRNLGGAGFADVTAQAGVLGSGVGQPAAAADYDGDGLLDLYVGNLPGKREDLFRNRTSGGNALVVRLVGTTSNRAAIGARVVVRVGQLDLRRDVQSSSGRSSQDQLWPHFGIGDATVVDEIQIRWPSGAVQRIEDVAVGVVDVVEPDQN